MEIEFLPIPDFPGYCAGSDGTIWSQRRQNPSLIMGELEWRKLRFDPKKFEGRKIYTLCKNGNRYRFSGGQLVLRAFVGYPREGMECLHWDGDCTNDNLNNLRWGTRAENVQDSLRHGSYPRGENHWQGKLTMAQVRDCRNRVESRQATQVEMSRELNVSKQLICMICKYKIWKDAI